MYKNKDLSIARTFAYVYIAIQTIMSLIWMCGNAVAFYPEQLSLNYIEAAKTLIVDDYMGILYALFLSPIALITSNYSVIHGIVSLLQVILVFGSFLYFSRVVFENRIAKCDRIMLSLFATTIPAVVQAEFSVLPNSLTLCLFVILYADIHSLVFAPKKVTLVSLLIVCGLLPALSKDYFALVLLILTPVIIYLAINRKMTALLYVGSAVLMLAIMFFIVNTICVPESYGRIERSFVIYIAQRISMPHLLDGLGVLKEYSGSDHYENIKNAINIPEMFFSDFLMSVKEACGGSLPLEFFKDLIEKSLILRTRSAVTALVKDIIFGTVPFLSLIYIYVRRTTETVTSVNLLRFMREMPGLSRGLLVMYLSGMIMAPIIVLIKKIRVSEDLIEAERKDRVSFRYLTYVIFVFSAYYSVFSFYGYDYRNALFAFSVPFVYIFASLFMKETVRDGR